MDDLVRRLDQGFAEIKGMLTSFDERIRGLETREAGCQPLLTARLEAAWRKLDEHDAEIKTLSALVSTQNNQVSTMRGIASWALGLLTLILGAVLVALATGKATLIFR